MLLLWHTMALSLGLVRGLNLTSEKDAVGVVRINSESAYLQDGGVNLSCSLMYRSAAYTSWTIDDRPPEDSALESILTGRAVPGLWLREHRLEIRRLDRLPSASGRYQFVCAAVVDGNLTRASLFVASLFVDTCRGDGQCSARGAVCRGGRCVCEGALKVRLLSRHTTCRHAAFLDWPCSYHEQCQVPGSHCAQGGVCACPDPLRPQGQHCVAAPSITKACQCRPCPAVQQRPVTVARSVSRQDASEGLRSQASTLCKAKVVFLLLATLMVETY